MPSGWVVAHCEKKLGIYTGGYRGRRPNLWPLDHSVRIDVTTGVIDETQKEA